MSDQFLSLLVESLVAVLLVLTIGYCLVLNRRLKRLRSDEASLRTTIAELVTATTVAHRAIEGLRATVADCDATLGERLRHAERMTADLDRDLERGDEVLSRIQRIVAAMNVPGTEPEPEPAPVAGRGHPARAADTAAAAQALASRARARVGRAA